MLLVQETMSGTSLECRAPSKNVAIRSAGALVYQAVELAGVLTGDLVGDVRR